MADNKTYELPAPIRIIQDSRYLKQNGWEFDDISLCSSGKIAVCGHNDHQSCVCIYGNTAYNSDSKNKAELLFTVKRNWTESQRSASFIKPDSTEIVTCHYDEVEVKDYTRDVVLRSRKVNGVPTRLSVSEDRILIGLKSGNVNIYDINLNRINFIRLKETTHNWEWDLAAAADRLFVGVKSPPGRATLYSLDGGKELAEYTPGQDMMAWSVAVNTQLELAAVLWGKRYPMRKEITFYPLSEKRSFLTVNVQAGVSRIRISDQGMMATGTEDTGDVEIYDLGSLFWYSHLKESLVSRLGMTDDCKKLADFFAVEGEKWNTITDSKGRAEILLLAFEEKDILQPSNVDKLREAFLELKMSPSLCHAVNLYQKLRANRTINIEYPPDREQRPNRAPTEVNPENPDEQPGNTTYAGSQFHRRKQKLIGAKVNSPVHEASTIIKGSLRMLPPSYNWKDLVSTKPANRTTHIEKARKREQIPERALKDVNPDYPDIQSGVGGSNSLTTSSSISSKGGVIKLGNTGVKLEIPPKALQNDKEEQEIQIRILPHHILDEDAKCFEDHSTTMVEILPNNLQLKKYATLTLPHCLIVKDEKSCKVQVFLSHHTEGKKPVWEDFSESANPIVSGAFCKILLNKFCWVKFVIRGENVIGKMVFVYTAGEKVKSEDDCITALVGCFPALPGYNRVDATRQDFINAGNMRVCEDKLQGYFIGPNWDYFIFNKSPKEPIKIRLTNIFPNDQWTIPQNQLEPKTISYQSIELSKERNWKFTFERKQKEVPYPTCHFEISHLEENVGIIINLQKLQDGDAFKGSRIGMCNHDPEQMEIEEIVP